MQQAQVRSLVGKLRPHVPRGTAKRFKKEKESTEEQKEHVRLSNGTRNTGNGMCELSRFSDVRLCNPMTVACQTALSMAYPRQEYWRPPSQALGILLLSLSDGYTGIHSLHCTYIAYMLLDVCYFTTGLPW